MSIAPPQGYFPLPEQKPYPTEGALEESAKYQKNGALIFTASAIPFPLLRLAFRISPIFSQVLTNFCVATANLGFGTIVGASQAIWPGCDQSGNRAFRRNLLFLSLPSCALSVGLFSLSALVTNTPLQDWRYQAVYTTAGVLSSSLFATVTNSSIRARNPGTLA